MLNSQMPGDHSNRRRRNIVLPSGSDTDEENSVGINWSNTSTLDEPIYDVEELADDEDQMAYDLEEYEEDYATETGHEDILGNDTGLMMIGNKPINLEKFKIKKQPLSVEKLTIYLDKNLMSILKILKQNKSINSYSQCITEALEQYLTT